MKSFKKSLLLAISGIFAMSLSGCSIQDLMFWKKKGDENQEDDTPVNKDPLVIPAVDVEHLNITLPELPTYNQGAIKSDDTYDYIDLYEISDFHGIVDYRPSDSEAYLGLAKLATYFNQKRALNEGGTLVLSSGDMFQGSADSNSTRGFMVNYAMHYMGFDAMAVGNHEFDWTTEWLKKNAELKYGTHEIPYLGINILEKESGEIPSFIKKSTIVERGKYKIGIIGAIGEDLESSILYSCVKDYDFVKEGELISAEAARLRSEDGCDVVVLLEHQGLTSIPVVTGVDAIFGGHAHVNKKESVGTIPAVATKNYGRSVAHIGLKINKETAEVSVKSSEYDVMTNTKANNLEDNAGIVSIMSQYAPSINSIKNIELGKAVDDLAFDNALKNICTRTMYDRAYELAQPNEQIDESKILCAFHNVNGGIRDDIKAGKITYGSVYSAFPFDNEVVLLQASGALLKTKLRNFKELGVYRLFKTNSDINADETYYIVTTDYLALGTFNDVSTGLDEIDDSDLIRTGLIVRDIVAEKLYKLDKIKTADFSNSEQCYKNIPMTF